MFQSHVATVIGGDIDILARPATLSSIDICTWITGQKNVHGSWNMVGLRGLVKRLFWGKRYLRDSVAYTRVEYFLFFKKK